MHARKRKELEHKIRRAITRELSKGFDIGGWEPANLASWIAPAVMRVIVPRKRKVVKP